MRWHWGWWFGLAVGSAAMYFLDREHGCARRQRAAERARSAMRRRELRNAARARDEAREANLRSNTPVWEAGAWTAAV